MSSLSFQPVSDGLYVAVGDASPAIAVYWVLLDGAPPAGDLDPGTTWSSWSGGYVLVPADKPVTDPGGFVADVRLLFGAPQPNIRGVAWVADPAAVGSGALYVTGVIGGKPGVAQTTSDLDLPFGNVSFTASTKSTLSYDPSPAAAPGIPSIVIASSSQGGVVGLVRQGQGTNLAPDGAVAVVPLGGPSAGAVVFTSTWDRGDLYSLLADQPSGWDTAPGVEVRFFYGATGAEQTLRYPVFLGQATTGAPADQLPLAVALDVFAPWDPARTLLALDLPRYGGQGGPVLPTCTTLASTDGAVVELVPAQGAGLAFGRRPQGASPEASDAYVYLVPSGPFEIAPEDGPPIRHLMCGLAGTEFVMLAPGATVELVPQRAAYSAGFTAPSNGGGGGSDPCAAPGPDQPVDPADLMTADFTTAWLRVHAPETAVAPIDRGYAMQPSAAVYYGSSQDSGYAYPLALGCRVSTLVDVESEAPPVAVPLAPYGDVWATGASTLPTADVLRAFESQVVSPSRMATAPKDMVNGPVIFEVDTHTPVDGGTAMTPEGLLATLNRAQPGPAGTFASLQLAKSPNIAPKPDAAELSFTGSPVMAPDLSYALMNESLFMVATDPDALGGLGQDFKNLIQMGEWTFRLDVGYTEDQASAPRTILVFKLTTAFSLVDLAGNAAYWQGWQTFIDPDPAKVKVVQAQLNALLCLAKYDPKRSDADNALFADFWAKAIDPNWTGILGMGCGLDAADLPIDLQDLLGGISGELRPHHFGITVNRVTGADSQTWAMDTSSLFALIHYEMAYGHPPPIKPATAFAFQVLRLNVLFENSALVHFDSRIAVTIPQLFSTEVVLAPCGDPNVPSGYNALEIEGVYQRHGDTGTVVFDTTTPQVFTFKTTTSGFRVLQEVYVTDAALVPITSTTDGGTITVTSSLALSGALMFVGDVSTAPHASAVATTTPPMDLFSYGATTPPTGLGFQGYSIAMTTQITDNVGHISQIGPDLSQLRVTPATSPVRPGSLLSALPLKLTGLLQQPDSSGWPVSFTGASGNPFAASYAIELQASLGSLGALSAQSVGLDIDLILGWEAATGSGNDQVWMLMVPPATMLGTLGFGVEGVISAMFTKVQLGRQTWPASGTPSWTVYAFNFVNVFVQLLGLPFPGVGDITLFANPSQGASSNIGWLMSFRSPIVPPGT